MKSFPFFIFFLLSVKLFSQTDLNYKKTEEFILKFKKDSAVHYLNKIENESDRIFLKEIILADDLSYENYYKFIAKLTRRENIDHVDIVNYINKEIKQPESYNILNRNYFNIKWILITYLRDKTFLDLASIEHSKLESYVANFTKKNKNFLWANTKLQTHPIVMYLIEKKVNEGKTLTLDCLEVAKKLNDVELEITFLYYSLGFLILEQKLDEYISTCEKILDLEKKLSTNSPFYYSTIIDLINACIFKGGYDEKVLQLMDELYNSESKIYSYALYAQLLDAYSDNLELKEKILSKFNVSNVLELVQKFEKLGENLNLNDYYDLINKSAYALSAYKYYDEA